MEKILSPDLFEQALHAARHDLNILIQGETGSGKEVLSDFIQENSERKQKPYVKLNCAAIPATLIESELFGHEKGAFTGAERKKQGWLEIAHTGTMLLDEIGDMPVELQPRLLRVTEGHSFSRIGSNEELSVDVRFISSTHINIERAIEEKKFRSDLYYRLTGAIIVIPPLRERKDEILKIAETFLKFKQDQQEIGSEIKGFTSEAKEALLEYPWPGNFRELENKIYSGALRAKGYQISKGDMFQVFDPPMQNVTVDMLSDLNLDRLHEGAILEALRRSNYLQKGAARLLGISPRALNHWIKQRKIKHPSWLVNV